MLIEAITDEAITSLPVNYHENAASNDNTLSHWSGCNAGMQSKAADEAL
jgi:hypothetical protein